MHRDKYIVILTVVKSVGLVNNAICSHIDGPRDILVKCNKSKKDTYHVICVESKKMIQMNLLMNRNGLMDIENRFMVTKGEWDGMRG